MCLHDGSRDREADAGAAVLARSRGVDAVEALEQARQRLGRDADSGVGDAHLDRAVVTVRLDAHLASLGGESDSVVDEVEDHLVHALGVGLDRREIVGHVAAHVDVAIGARHLDLRHHLRHQRAERDLLAAQRHLARLELREIEQLLHEAAESLGLRQHHLEDLGVRLLDAVEQVLQVRPDRGDRRLELVGDVGDQVAPRCLEELELRAHAVEGDRELSDLVARVRVDAGRVVAGLHATRSLGHVAQRLRHAAGEPPSQIASAITAAIAPASRNCHHTLCRNPSVADMRPRTPRVGDGYSDDETAAVVGGDRRPHVVADHAPPRHPPRGVGRQHPEVHALDRDLTDGGATNDHRVRRRIGERAARDAPGERERVDRLGIRGEFREARSRSARTRSAIVIATAKTIVAAELAADRGQALERSGAHDRSWNAYPTPCTVRMNRGSLPSSPSLRRMRATWESTTRPPAKSR